MSFMEVAQSPPSGQCINVMDMNQHTRFEYDTVHQKRIVYIISSFHRFTKITFSKTLVPMPTVFHASSSTKNAT